MTEYKGRKGSRTHISRVAIFIEWFSYNLYGILLSFMFGADRILPKFFVILLCLIFSSFMCFRKWNDYVIVSKRGIVIHMHPGWLIYHRCVDYSILWVDVQWYRIQKSGKHWYSSKEWSHLDDKLFIKPKHQEKVLSFHVEDYRDDSLSIYSSGLADLLDLWAGHKKQKSPKKKHY